MRIVFISNYFNHHQKALSEELSRLTNGEYTFVETVPMTEERQKMGWVQEEKPSYVISGNRQEDAFAKIDCADVVILGSAPKNLVSYAMKKGKVIFRYSERPLKKGMEPLKYLPRLIKWHFQNPFFRPVYLLCASAYTAGDYAKFGLFRNKCFQWGYFPKTRRYTDIDKLLKEKDSVKILWAGRFLDLKHPEDVLKAAKKLKEGGYRFSVDFIGTGILEADLKAQVKAAGISEEVHFLGSMSPEAVRDCMETAGIYLFTSDRQEGWGAVLNESMNSGCAVVASHEIGSVPFLISNEENGLVYQSGNVDMLYENIKDLLEHPEKQKRLGKAAYETIVNEWNGETASERLIHLTNKLLSGEREIKMYESGPCSAAPVIKESWFQS